LFGETIKYIDMLSVCTMVYVVQTAQKSGAYGWCSLGFELNDNGRADAVLLHIRTGLNHWIHWI
jgi:hypothetical protein